MSSDEERTAQLTEPARAGNAMTATLDSLRAARALLADPARWTKGSYARTKSGSALGIRQVHETRAHCWCLVGALHRAGNLASSLEALAIDEWHLILFNDNATHEDVLALLDHSIARLEAA